MKTSIIYIAIVVLGNAVLPGSQSFHTPPDLWEEPRFFQTEMKREELAEDIQVKQVQMQDVEDSLHLNEKNVSPNNVYWCLMHSVVVGSGDVEGKLLIYNERDELIELSFDYYSNLELKTEWVNEKLLYIRIWKGRVLAIDMIYDVEKEDFIYHEYMHEGTIPFMQFKGQAKASKKE